MLQKYRDQLQMEIDQEVEDEKTMQATLDELIEALHKYSCSSSAVKKRVEARCSSVLPILNMFMSVFELLLIQ